MKIGEDDSGSVRLLAGWTRVNLPNFPTLISAKFTFYAVQKSRNFQNKIVALSTVFLYIILVRSDYSTRTVGLTK